MSTDSTPTTVEIEAEIEQTREELGATVDELAHRLDVKSRAAGKASEVKAQMHDKAVDVSHTVRGGAAGVKGAAQRRGVQAAAGVAVLGLGAALIAHRRTR